MLSNLVKQYYVANSSETTRIIDSNKRAEEVIKARGFSGFQPLNFIKADEVVEEVTEEIAEENDAVSEDIEKILEEARAQADEIIKIANRKAEEILINANKKAERIYEDSKKKGYEEGSQDKLADVMKMQEGVVDEINTKKQELENEYQLKADTMERDIVEVLIQVFNKVFHIQFDNKKEILIHLIKSTLMNVEVGKEFRIHVSHNNYKFINSHLDDIKQNIGNDVNIEVVNDAALGAQDCQIETNFGVFDCGIDMELNALIKDIRTLCS